MDEDGAIPGSLARGARRRATRTLVTSIIVAATVALTVTACSDSGSGAAGSTAGSTASSTTEAGRRVRLIAPNGLRGLLDRERRDRGGSTTTTASTLPPTTTVVPTAPYPVAQITKTFTDTTRSQPARDGTPEQPARTIHTTIWYPTSMVQTAENPTPQAARPGQYPLVVFAHGFDIDAASYSTLLHDIAMGGYVVAAPDFPGTSTVYAGAPVREDSLNQPFDMSFVISQMMALAQEAGPLQGAIAPGAVGVNGQSDGGVTATAAAWNTCCQDPRIKAGAIYTGATFAFEGEWFPPGSPPIMFVHGTADEINGYGASTSMFERAQSPKYLLSIDGGTHLEPYVDPPWVTQVAAATVAFFDQYLKADPNAAQRLDAIGTQPGYTLEQG
jgi:predicted dienelactone hydrolase